MDAFDSEQLREENRRLADENRQLRGEAASLRGELAAVRKELDDLRQQHNQLLDQHKRLLDLIESQQRASMRQAAPFRREPHRLVEIGHKKRPGRKAGHPGFYRREPEHIDEVIDVPLERCPRCGGGVWGVELVEQIVEEIPVLRPRVYAVRTRRGQCGCCGKVSSTHPLVSSWGTGCCKARLGPRAVSAGAFLNKALGLTMRKTVSVLGKLFGLKLTAGGLSQALVRLADRASLEHQKLTETIRGSPAVYADETSWYVGDDGGGTQGSNWLWTFTTPEATLYRVDRRSSDVVKTVLAEDFGGVLVSDCLASYNPMECLKHKCIAHHLRAIKEARELPGNTDASYLDAWKTLFKQTILLCKLREEGKRGGDGIPSESFAIGRANLESEKVRLLTMPVGQPGDIRIRNRLAKHDEHLLRCLSSADVDPTNNRAERALRPAVIARKLSCGNRSRRGQHAWEILASLAATAQQTGKDFIDSMIPLLQRATYAR